MPLGLSPELVQFVLGLALCPQMMAFTPRAFRFLHSPQPEVATKDYKANNTSAVSKSSRKDAKEDKLLDVAASGPPVVPLESHFLKRRGAEIAEDGLCALRVSAFQTLKIR